MATPTRKLILDDLQTTLAAILTSGGYKTDVVTVEMLIKDWTGVGAEERPWVGYMPQRERLQYQPFGRIRSTLPIIIGAHVYADTKAAVVTAVENLRDDIIAALNADTTRGGNARFTTIIETEDDLGDPDSVDHDGVSGTLTINAEIVYQRGTGSS